MCKIMIKPLQLGKWHAVYIEMVNFRREFKWVDCI